MENPIKEDLQKIAADYTFKNGIIKNPGKFEGESIMTPYFYEASLNGDGETISLYQFEKDFFKIDSKFKYVKILESDSGFVTLDFLTEEEYYSQEFESDEEDDEEEDDESGFDYVMGSIDLDSWSE